MAMTALKNILLTAFFCFYMVPLVAQQKPVAAPNSTFTAAYDGGDIAISYTPSRSSGLDSLSVSLYRKGAKQEDLLKSGIKIPANRKWMFADTTVRTQRGVYEYRLVVRTDTILLAEEIAWGYAYPPDARPVAGVFQALKAKDSNSIRLRWSIDNNFTLRNMVLQRSRQKEGTYTSIATLDASDTSYIDQVDDANEPFFYRLDMHTLNSGAVYRSAAIFVIPEFPIVPLSPVNLNAKQRGKSIELSWESIDDRATGFYVKKRAANTGEFLLSSARIAKNSSNRYRYTDTSSTLVANGMYQYLVLAESNSFHQSKTSDTVTLSYSAIRPVLSPPQALQIISANDTTYSLVWEVDSLRMNEVTDYAVYIKTKGNREFRLLDSGVVDGRQNYATIPRPADGSAYQVRSIAGSAKSAFSQPYIYSNAFEKQFGPMYLKAGIIENQLYVKWLESPDVPVKEYRLYSWNGNTFILSNTVAAGNNNCIVRNYIPGRLNIYQLRTVDTSNLESTGSNILQVN